MIKEGVDQTNIDDFAEKNPFRSWGCKKCGFHAKNDIRKGDHEKVLGHNDWTELEWPNKNELMKAPDQFNIVKPLC